MWRGRTEESEAVLFRVQEADFPVEMKQNVISTGTASMLASSHTDRATGQTRARVRSRSSEGWFFCLFFCFAFAGQGGDREAVW